MSKAYSSNLTLPQYEFMSLVATTRKLGVSFFEYMHDRILKIADIPCLGTIIREKSSSNPFAWSWMPE
jgi:hypothetical protein